jgi:hypothetical protein
MDDELLPTIVAVVYTTCSGLGCSSTATYLCRQLGCHEAPVMVPAQPE